LDHVTAESVISAFRKLRDPVVLHELQQQAAAGGREFNATVAAERLAALFAMMFDPASGRSSSPEPILSSGRDETLESIRAAYRDYREDGRSALWEQSNAGNRRSSAARDAELVRLVLRSASSDAASSILDVGCGNGRFAGLLLEQRVPLKVTGIDLLPDRVRTARERVPEADFVVGSADEIPFPDSSFDAASAITLFSSVPSLTMESAIAREIDRVLRPGGSLVWYDIRYKNPWNRRVHGVTTRHLEALFPGWSMEVHSITLLPPVARRLGRLTSVGYPALHSLPILRSHLIGTLRKPT
jgi:ubiquinone/menaquinone biosynthesis C-methylase UbiE